MSKVKKYIKLIAKKRGHQLASFLKSYYDNSIYETATCRYCNSKVFLQDGELKYESVTEFDCIKQENVQ
jgi:DNA-directed RNA polymerase subunit RPC12/RpoP